MLTAEQIGRFNAQGFLHRPRVFREEQVLALLKGVESLSAQGLAAGDERQWWQALHETAPTPQARTSLDLRNVAMAAGVFADLVEEAEILVPVLQILGPRVALLSSHAAVRGQAGDLSAGDLARLRLGWHRDLGVSSVEMAEPHPRLAVKAAIWLTRLDGPGQGAMRVIPGSHRLIGGPAFDPRTNQPYGAMEIFAGPGDVLFFEQRLWHAGAPNLSPRPRVALFYCYGYRWLRPQDYTDLSADQLTAMSPVRQQLFGRRATAMGYHLPAPEDVPLQAWFEEWKVKLRECNPGNP